MRQFVESIKRLYESNQIGDVIVLTLCKRKKITEAEKAYILNKTE